MYSPSFLRAFDGEHQRFIPQYTTDCYHQQQQQQQQQHQLHLDASQALSPKSSSIQSVLYGAFPNPQNAVGCGGGGAEAEDVRGVCFGWGSADNWGDSGVVLASPRTETTSPDLDTDERNQSVGNGHGEGVVVLDSYDRSGEKLGTEKTLRRLTQNREAARRSRLRKKVYIQQLETNCLRLTQLEQELERARQEGPFIGRTFHAAYHSIGGGSSTFDLEYARWLEEHQKKIIGLRSAVNSQAGDIELRLLVDAIMLHYDEVFRLKNIAAKADVFHVLSGMWITPAERCFMWLGGFRSSALLKILASHVEPLTDQQLMGICNLQQSSQQAEDALSQGMDALQQSLTDILASGSLPTFSGADGVAIYMTQMASAMGKLGTLETFLHQADLLRQQTLQQMYRILNTRQAAHALLAINDYFSRLRALSSLWLARPRD